MRIPIATYRLQFSPAFGFDKARQVLDYLQQLGISEIYASPIFQARKDSEHGYDVVDHNRLNPQLGSEEDFRTLSDAVKSRGLGWLQDWVPNHMAFDAENPMLTDVLENGSASKYSRCLDIDWERTDESAHFRLLAPFLGEYFGAALEGGEIRLDYAEEGFYVGYYQRRFPLQIESYLEILSRCLRPLRRELGEEHPDYMQLLGILYLLRTLRPDTVEDERYEQISFIKKNLWLLYRKSPAIRRGVDTALSGYRGSAGEPESFNPLELLLAQQWFRLSYWKVAAEEINYRRFFCINDLISLRMEQPEAFARAHRLLFQLLDEGRVTGVRIDHIDGLYDPGGYLEQVRQRAPQAYMVVEKILEFGEPLPAWPIQGATGYEFLNRVNALFCDPRNEKSFTAAYTRFAGQTPRVFELEIEKKRLILEKHMAGDLNNLTAMLKNLASHHRYGTDITLHGLHRALAEIMVRLPVYRTYLGPQGAREVDLAYIRQAVDQTVEQNPGLTHEAGFIGKILRLDFDDFHQPEERGQWLHFVMRFQQFTGPLTAKGFEDTLLYVYNRLLSLNEVGSSPERFGAAPGEFHSWCRDRRANWPHTLNATATHDTKRGEDVRARLNVLSEIPQLWRQALGSWSRLNRPLKTSVGRRRIPDKNDEYFLYQTLVGAWPAQPQDVPEFAGRLREYLVKAVREAKVHTAWIKPDQAYEEAFVRFAEGILDPGHAFIQEFLPFQRRIAFFGLFNSLAQTLIKITAPGIPDFYQGSELWDLSLVDPDNRRPVDFVHRQKALQAIREAIPTDQAMLGLSLLKNWEDGRVKLFLIHQALKARRRNAELFSQGEYLPIKVEGGSERVVAFARSLGGQTAVTVVPRLVTGLVEENVLPLGPQVWGETLVQLPEATTWTDALTGHRLEGARHLPLGEILQRFPVALLVSAPPLPQNLSRR